MEHKKILEQVITPSEAAEITGKTLRVIQRQCKSGEIVARRAKGTWLILKSSLQES